MKILFAPDSGSKPSPEAIPQLAIDQLRTVVRQVYEIEHGKALSEEDDLDDNELVALIHDQVVDWRSEPRMDLPEGNVERRSLEDQAS